MNIFEYELDGKVYIPDYVSEELSNTDICFFDIETTGLSSKYCQVILIGLMCVEGDRTYIKQFFADNPDEETEILKLFTQFIDRFDYLISYNGKSFDIPFLKNRLEYHHISQEIDKIPHLDLLQLVRKHKKLLDLENCKLKTVERSLNIYREDTISGKDSVDLYKAYVYSRDSIKRDIILKHNYDDIFYLPKLLSIYDLIEEKSVLKMNINFKGTNLNLKVDKNDVNLRNSTLSILGVTKRVNLPPQIHYKDLYSLNWNTTSGDVEFQVYYKTGKLSNGSKCFYLDLEDSDLDVKADKLNHKLTDNIVLIQVDELIIYDNILNLIESIFLNLD